MLPVPIQQVPVVAASEFQGERGTETAQIGEGCRDIVLMQGGDEIGIRATR